MSFFGGVPLANANGDMISDRIFATSLQTVSLGAGEGNVLCAIANPLDVKRVLRLDAEATYVGLEDDQDAVVQVDVTEFTIACVV
ncbi:uncharacterized protein SETTUDRAFT_22602 [Exserohilum turcica Et28A]|uniref:Uncharacterized protein n=1 Tax=Exserohilum turcicum (strain 28A) TaxID=671987 RepID=R0IB61_EXST2|nr:uncharacterized protein SETTUDRAFT_22602 [Exserohilum turcica Et28A]EOA82620.1 hypothetical protein SETTUDRAFT_22602 [Exserohilum turcica Et28A]